MPQAQAPPPRLLPGPLPLPSRSSSPRVWVGSLHLIHPPLGLGKSRLSSPLFASVICTVCIAHRWYVMLFYCFFFVWQADFLHLLSGLHISHAFWWEEVPLPPHAAKVLLLWGTWCLIWVSATLRIDVPRSRTAFYCKILLLIVFFLCTSVGVLLVVLPFCRTFNWALSMGGKVPVSEGLEHTDLPDGTGEFLDAWLMLVEKMVNPSTVLDSPHSLPAKMPGVTPTMPQFSALRFLIVTQKVSIWPTDYRLALSLLLLSKICLQHGKSLILPMWHSSG